MSSSPSPTDATLADRLGERFRPARAVTPLAPDASVRRFFRIERIRGRPRVAMVDAGGGRAALARMVSARALLGSLGVRVPKLEDRDDDLCALLFEYLGDTLLADALPALDAEQQRAIYREAGLFAGLIASAGTPRVNQDHPLSHPRLGRERLRWELSLFATQDVGGRRGINHGLFADLSELLHRIADAAAAGPQELAHRDFHARNLMLLPGARIAVVDYQDTLFAPRYFDLASLVCDPYVDPAEPLVAAAVAGYRETERLQR